MLVFGAWKKKPRVDLIPPPKNYLCEHMAFHTYLLHDLHLHSPNVLVPVCSSHAIHCRATWTHSSAIWKSNAAFHCLTCRHDRTRLLCAELCDCAVEHVDLVEEVHGVDGDPLVGVLALGQDHGQAEVAWKNYVIYIVVKSRFN